MKLCQRATMLPHFRFLYQWIPNFVGIWNEDTRLSCDIHSLVSTKSYYLRRVPTATFVVILMLSLISAACEDGTPTQKERVRLSVGHLHTCSLQSNGEVVCWGDDSTGQSSPPGGEFVSISAGRDYTCGLRTDGEVVCWGNDSAGQSSPPDGEFMSISAGAEHACGLQTNGEVTCWGNVFMSNPPSGGFSSVSAGAAHTCGLRENGEAVCWGSDLHGQSNPPNGKFSSVSAGKWHTCGLRTNGEAMCWGEPYYADSLTPPSGRFSSVSAGSHTCGLRESGEAVCWGSDDFGQSSPPKGERFESISAGVNHTCGLRTDGEVVCWGSDIYGQSSPHLKPTVWASGDTEGDGYVNVIQGMLQNRMPHDDVYCSSVTVERIELVDCLVESDMQIMFLMGQYNVHDISVSSTAERHIGINWTPYSGRISESFGYLPPGPPDQNGWTWTCPNGRDCITDHDILRSAFEHRVQEVREAWQAQLIERGP